MFSFVKHSGLRKYLASTSWMMLEHLVRLIIALPVGIYLARYLGPAQLGKLNYSISLIFIFSVLADLGLRLIIMRDLSRFPEHINEILGTAFVLKLIGGGIALLMAGMTIIYLRPEEPFLWNLVHIMAFILIFQSFDVIEMWFHSQVNSKYPTLARLLVSSSMALIKVFLIFIKASLIAFAWTYLAEFVLTALGFIMAYKLDRKAFRNWKPSYQMAKQLLATSWPMLFIGLSVLVQGNIDQIMIGQIWGDSEVGQYSAAANIVMVLSVVSFTICSAISPAIARSRLYDTTLYYSRLLLNYRLMFLLFLLFAVPISLFAKPIIQFLYGNAFKEAGELLALLSIRIFFYNFNTAKYLFFTNENLLKYAFFTESIGALIKVSLNYVLIPQFHAKGAIFASIISYIIAMFILDLFSRKTFQNLKLMLYGILTPWKLSIK